MKPVAGVPGSRQAEIDPPAEAHRETKASERRLRVCWMLSSAGEARIALPAAAEMAKHGIDSVLATWLTES